jgi:hypothetical protein
VERNDSSGERIFNWQHHCRFMICTFVRLILWRLRRLMLSVRLCLMPLMTLPWLASLLSRRHSADNSTGGKGTNRSAPL